MPRPVRLRRALERVIREGHPWIYRDALEEGWESRPGDEVTVLDRKGRFLARGHADSGPIAVRVWTTRDEAMGMLLGRRIRRAAALRAWIRPSETTAYRLVHGEADGAPGCVIDVYGEVAVLRLDGEGATALRDRLARAAKPVLDEMGITTLLARSGRRGEIRVDTMYGEAPDGPITVLEHGMQLVGDLRHGQKTGLFLDHRESRRRVRELSPGRSVLNLYSYTGGFSVAAGLGGATRVTSVDVAPGAIEMARRTWQANDLTDDAHEAIVSDVPDYLDALANDAQFDIVISDPPSFAPNARSVQRAVESYTALHARCLRRVKPGGLLLAASCSSHITRDHFDETLREAARETRIVTQVLERSGAPADHPRLLAFPEFDYLKVTLCRVLG